MKYTIHTLDGHQIECLWYGIEGEFLTYGFKPMHQRRKNGDLAMREQPTGVVPMANLSHVQVGITTYTMDNPGAL